MNGGVVYGVFNYEAQNDDELGFDCGDMLTVVRRGDDFDREWWWVTNPSQKSGYIPRNLLGVSLFYKSCDAQRHSASAS